jgi:subtilisin family serine protease
VEGIRRRARPVAGCCAGLAAGVALCLGSAADARAELVFTAQAAAANAMDSTWIPAPPQRAAVCIVDSGVDLNPDTTNVVARLAVNPSDGGGVGDVSTQKHGTMMAMIASAPYNGFGMVGAAPSVNVVSVRAMSPGSDDTVGLNDLLRGIQTCALYRDAYNIKVISISLGAPNLGTIDAKAAERIRNLIDLAHQRGLAVVAAAGNRPGSVDWPAASPEVLPIGAVTSAGDPCPFASSGPEVRLSTLGCPQDVALADGSPALLSGSSGATAFVAGVLAQLRGLRSDLAFGEAEAMILSGAQAPPGARRLDVAAAFRVAGLDPALVRGAAARPAIPATAPPTATTQPPPGTPAFVQKPTGRTRLPRPRVSIRQIGNATLRIQLRGKPVHAVASIRVYARRSGSVFPRILRSIVARSSYIRLRVTGTVSQVTIMYRDLSGVRANSIRVDLHPRRP